MSKKVYKRNKQQLTDIHKEKDKSPEKKVCEKGTRNQVGKRKKICNE